MNVIDGSYATSQYYNTVRQNQKNSAEEKKAATKKTTIQASSADNLLKKINEIDWSNVREDKKTESNRLDVSI